MEPTNTQTSLQTPISDTNLSSSWAVENVAPVEIDVVKKRIIHFFQALGVLLYLPATFFVFALSAMAGDSPNASGFSVLTAMLFINGGFFAVAMAMIYLYGKIGERLIPKIKSNFLFVVAMILTIMVSLPVIGILFSVLMPTIVIPLLLLFRAFS